MERQFSTVQSSSEYEVLEELGTGAFGCVVKCRHVATGEVVAVKKLKREAADRRTADEISNHALLRHPHVIKFKKAFATPNHINIVMEYANSGTLFQLVRRHGRLSELGARWFFQQLVLAVDYCHRAGVCMRDIKLENMLLHTNPNTQRPLLKVCDFGYSKHDNRSLPKSQVGTVAYMAPEVLTCDLRTPHVYCGKSADIWSCGVMLYAMLAGGYPFQPPEAGLGFRDARQVVDMLQRMQMRQYELPPALGISDSCRHLLSRLLEPSVAHRATIADIQAHPWFREGLPPSALVMNDSYLRVGQAALQSFEDIQLMVAAAITNSPTRRPRDRLSPGSVYGEGSSSGGRGSGSTRTSGNGSGGSGRA